MKVVIVSFYDTHHKIAASNKANLAFDTQIYASGNGLLYSSIMEIVSKWKNHPLTNQGVVELVPTDWLFNIYGTDVSAKADLVDGTLVSLETLWSNIQKEGLHEPLIIRVGKENKKFRLESGNHRIQVFKKHGVKYAPATVQIQNECGPQAENVMTDANHNFDLDNTVAVDQLEAGFAKPSAIFTTLRSQIKPF